MSDTEIRIETSETVQHHIPALRRYARTLERDPDAADDLVQDCVERALTRFHRYRPGTNLRTWLFTILHNIHCDKRRREQRRGPHVPIDDWMRTAQAPAEQPRAMQMRDFRRAFNGLEDKDRQILVMIGYADYSYEQASAELDLAVGTVKSRLFRARRRLQERDAALARPAELPPRPH